MLKRLNIYKIGLYKLYNACHFQLGKVVSSVFHVQGMKTYAGIGVKLYSR
jgi:hypothetical protein